MESSNEPLNTEPINFVSANNIENWTDDKITSIS